MNGKGNLVFNFLNVHDERPDDRVDVFLKHTVLSSSHSVRDHRTSKRLKITGLDSTQGGFYNVLVYPMRHRPISRIVRVIEDKTVQQTFVLPVDPNKVSSVQFPNYESLAEDLREILRNSRIEGYEEKRGADLYLALDDIRKAGLLNIYAKMKRTVFQNGRDVFSYVSFLTRLRGDRFFAKVQKELRDEVKNSTSVRLFHEVSGALHTPPPGFAQTDSFKTPDQYGNLQITFFCNPETLEFIIDADIDDAHGIGHIFQVLGHALTGGQTHPYDIHEILLYYQKIDPHYRLIV